MLLWSVKNMDSQQNSQRTIALSFSGGGFRAAGFSLGTMVLLEKIGWLEKTQAISSASGGSITSSFFLVSKANFCTQNPNDLFNKSVLIEKFYRPLKEFLESGKVANAILDKFGSNEKTINKAAKCYQAELEKIAIHPEKLNIMDQIWRLLESDRSPDCLTINSTDMTDASLFRFAMLRTQKNNKGLILGNMFLDLSDDSDNDYYALRILDCCYKLRLGDMIAASSCFPIGFEPIIFPDNFSDGSCLKEILAHHKSVALMDAGFYDNLALTSIESLRQDSENPNQTEKLTLPYGINIVIATDADNLEPSNALLAPENLGQVKDYQALVNKYNLPKFLLCPLINFLFGVFNFNYRFLDRLASIIGIKKLSPSTSLSGLFLDINKLAKLIPDRIQEFLPTFGAFLTRNRNLTYQFLQYKYEQENKNHQQENEKINLIRNLIFDLYNRNDPDTALSELVPKLTRLTDIQSPSFDKLDSDLIKQIRKINTLVLALMTEKNMANANKLKEQLGNKGNEYVKIKKLICLAKLATALPTTLWLKWYNFCIVKTQERNSTLIDAIVEEQSVLKWTTDVKHEVKQQQLYMTFATDSANSDTRCKRTAAEVVITCGFVAACYNLLEYSANKIGVLYKQSDIKEPQFYSLAFLSKIETLGVSLLWSIFLDKRNLSEEMSNHLHQKMLKLSQLNKHRDNPEILEKFAQDFRKKLYQLNLEDIEETASIWWEIISFTPSSAPDEENLHKFIKHIQILIEKVK